MRFQTGSYTDLTKGNWTWVVMQGTVPAHLRGKVTPKRENMWGNHRKPGAEVWLVNGHAEKASPESGSIR